MKRLRRSRSTAEVSPRSYWIITFSDLMTLLLTFFVLRFAMSSLNKEKLIEHLKSFPQAERVIATQASYGGSGSAEVPLSSRDNFRATETVLRDELGQELTASVGEPQGKERSGKTLKFQGDIELKSESGGTLVFLGGSTFLSGSTELSFTAQEAVRSVAKRLQGKSVAITVAGHSDNQAINTPEFPSNWELSAARAIAVARQMIDAGVDPQSISAVGYADSKPLAPNDTEAGRHRNRRVEIFIEPVADGRKSDSW